MLNKLSVIFILFFTASTVLVAQNKPVKVGINGEKLITDMARSRNMPPVVGDPGVLANTLLDTENAMPPEVKRILDLKEKSIPLLIAHLDDTRLTHMAYCCSEQPILTVGDACLNILVRIIVPAEPIFNKKCLEEEDDQIFCVEEKFDFTMSDYVRRGKKRIPSREVVRAKQKWLKAFRENKIRFKGY